MDSDYPFIKEFKQLRHERVKWSKLKMSCLYTCRIQNSASAAQKHMVGHPGPSHLYKVGRNTFKTPQLAGVDMRTPICIFYDTEKFLVIILELSTLCG